MARVILSFLFLTLAAIGIVWLVERPEDVVLIWQGQRIETSLAVIVAGIFLLAFALLILWSLLRLLVRLPGLIGRRDGARRREKGYAALSKGLVAVGSGDVVAAERHAREARRFVKGDPLSLLLDAQAAQLAGDREAARRAFRDMTQAGPARLLGWRGLFVEAQRAGDEEAAREAADAAVKIAPASAWANQAVLTDRFARGDWAGARLSLEQAERLRILDKATSKRQRAVLLTAEAEAAADPAQALALAREAVDLAPDLVPAATLAARILAERNDLRRAAKLLEAAWKVAPHPDLAETYVHLRSGDSALDRLQRAQTLAKLAPGDADGAFAVARAAIDARELSVARAALAPLVAERPTVRVCLLMADLAELGDDDHGETRHWLARAARAPRDKAWIGDGVVSDRWLPVSPATGRLDAFVWGAPPERLAPAAAADVDGPTVAPAPAIDALPSSPAPEGAPPEAASPPPDAPTPVPPADGTAPAAPAARPPRPTPVIFPVAQAPDDPGPKITAPPGRWRVFNG